MKPRMIARALIDPDLTQPRGRTDPEESQRLAQSIREFGLLQPLIVYESGSRFTLVEGHRRLEASGMADLTEVQCLVLSQKPDADTLLLTQLHANCLRVDLKPLELATAYKRLMDLRGCTLTELAEALHITKSMATQYMSFLTLPEEAKAMLDSGTLARSTAYAISREQDVAKRSELLAKAVRGELRRDDAATQVSQKPKSKPRMRSTFRLGSAEICIVTDEEVEIADCLEVLRQLTRECRRAAKQGLNITTLESVLADKAQNQT